LWRDEKVRLIKKIELLMTEKNVTKKKFSDESGIPYNTIRNFWIQGVDKMQLPTLRSLCNYFGVTMDSMARDDREIEYIAGIRTEPLGVDEKALLDKYTGLDERGKRTIQDTAERELEYSTESKKGLSSVSRNA